MDGVGVVGMGGCMDGVGVIAMRYPENMLIQLVLHVF